MPYITDAKAQERKVNTLGKVNSQSVQFYFLPLECIAADWCGVTDLRGEGSVEKVEVEVGLGTRRDSSML